MLAYAVGINYLRGGTAQVQQWFAAKFYNQASTSTTTGTSTSAGSPGGSTWFQAVSAAASGDQTMPQGSGGV